MREAGFRILILRQFDSLETAFTVSDLNKDGFLSRFEFQQLYHGVGGKEVDFHKISSLFRSIDTDNDGYISFTELRNYFSSQHSKKIMHDTCGNRTRVKSPTTLLGSKSFINRNRICSLVKAQHIDTENKKSNVKNDVDNLKAHNQAIAQQIYAQQALKLKIKKLIDNAQNVSHALTNSIMRKKNPNPDTLLNEINSLRSIIQTPNQTNSNNNNVQFLAKQIQQHRINVQKKCLERLAASISILEMRKKQKQQQIISKPVPIATGPVYTQMRANRARSGATTAQNTRLNSPIHHLQPPRRQQPARPSSVGSRPFSSFVPRVGLLAQEKQDRLLRQYEERMSPSRGAVVLYPPRVVVPQNLHRRSMQRSASERRMEELARPRKRPSSVRPPPLPPPTNNDPLSYHSVVHKTIKKVQRPHDKNTEKNNNSMHNNNNQNENSIMQNINSDSTLIMQSNNGNANNSTIVYKKNGNNENRINVNKNKYTINNMSITKSNTINANKPNNAINENRINKNTKPAIGYPADIKNGSVERLLGYSPEMDAIKLSPSVDPEFEREESDANIDEVIVFNNPESTGSMSDECDEVEVDDMPVSSFVLVPSSDDEDPKPTSSKGVRAIMSVTEVGIKAGEIEGDNDDDFLRHFSSPVRPVSYYHGRPFREVVTASKTAESTYLPLSLRQGGVRPSDDSRVVEMLSYRTNVPSKLPFRPLCARSRSREVPVSSSSSR